MEIGETGTWLCCPRSFYIRMLGFKPNLFCATCTRTNVGVYKILIKCSKKYIMFIRNTIGR